MSIYGRMYGARSKQPAVAPAASKESVEKQAARVLGGLKIHNSHVKKVQIGEDLIDVPKIEYVKLLEDQLRNARVRLKEAEIKIERLRTNHTKFSEELRNIRYDFEKRVVR